MCDCIELINDKLEEANTNTVLDIPMTLSMSSDDIKADRTTVTTRKKDSMARKKAQKVFASYCPFCGDKY